MTSNPLDCCIGLLVKSDHLAFSRIRLRVTARWSLLQYLTSVSVSASVSVKYSQEKWTSRKLWYMLTFSSNIFFFKITNPSTFRGKWNRSNSILAVLSQFRRSFVAVSSQLFFFLLSQELRFPSSSAFNTSQFETRKQETSCTRTQYHFSKTYVRIMSHQPVVSCHSFCARFQDSNLLRFHLSTSGKRRMNALCSFPAVMRECRWSALGGIFLLFGVPSCAASLHCVERVGYCLSLSF